MITPYLLAGDYHYPLIPAAPYIFSTYITARQLYLDDCTSLT